MTFYNEEKIRKLFKDTESRIFEINRNDIITPQAKQYLNDIKVKLICKKSNNTAINKEAVELDYQDPIKGKPDNMTHLRGKELIPKDSDIIVFRGKIDSYQSEILLIQSRLFELKDTELLSILENILNFVRHIMQAEVKEVPFDGWKYLGMTSSEVRERSHNPKKFYGVKHIVPDYKMGEKILLLNKLRSMVREVEITAVKAINSRFDIIEALNRLSSYLYICMIQVYAKEGNKI